MCTNRGPSAAISPQEGSPSNCGYIPREFRTIWRNLGRPDRLVFEMVNLPGRRGVGPSSVPEDGELGVGECVNALRVMRLRIRTFVIKCRLRGPNPRH